jgi:hypothetical protein
MDLKAKDHCCEEASPMSRDFYIPCNQPAARLVYLKVDRATYRMCEACADHNIRNRGGEDRGPYTSEENNGR